MKPFDPTKPCQTKSGFSARIICTDAKLVNRGENQPLIALVTEPSGNQWTSFYCASGHFWGNAKGNSDPRDLINIPEPKKWRAWKMEEVPIGALLRNKHGQKSMIIACNEERFAYVSATTYLNGQASFSSLQYHDALTFVENVEHSTDGGKTWSRCGVEE